MEFSRGRRESFYCSEEEDQEESSSSKHPPLFPSPPSSSSSSPSTLRWATPRTNVSSSEPTAASPSPSPSPSPVEREHMFDKVVTPSDVGKLNRLVIPKQHAEKYFPLDASSNEKGLLLNFEDRTGKPWRFRYSYWNSSQSYVMTKGWSRFVKEKRLDAGDTVSFCRGLGHSARDRLFIDWKRRPEPHDPPRLPRLPLPGNYPMLSFTRSVGPWGASRILVPPAAFDHHHHHHHHRSHGYGYINAATSSGSSSGGGSGGQYLLFRPSMSPLQAEVQPGNGGDSRAAGLPMILDSVPVVHSQAAAKRVRLFGVNLDCPESEGGGDADNSFHSQRMPLPHLQLQLGGVHSALTSSSSSPSPSSGKEQQSPLDLDM